MPFPAALELSTLDGTNGFRIDGENAGDASAVSVASAGDINGDGYEDLIIGATHATANGSQSGVSYVVYGKAGGFTGTINLSALDGTNGFRIVGEAGYDYSGSSVAAAGDINGDGYIDLLIGAPNADGYGNTNSGAAYVVFGKSGGFDADIELWTLNGSNGFKIYGQYAYDQLGGSVSSAGDVNGDGFDDLIIGARGAYGSFNPGAAFVVYGQASGFSSIVRVNEPGAVSDVRIGSTYSSGPIGEPVASAGDVNGDGYDDLIIGAANAVAYGETIGGAYVVFGQAGGLTANLDALDGTDGFRLRGQSGLAGASVAGAGDVNGDGYDDLVVGALYATTSGVRSGAAYVVFGKASGFESNLFLAALDGANGFKIAGQAADDMVGVSVASAGDVNGDGYDDLIIGASGADTNGQRSGSAYVVFGKAGGFAASFALSSLDGTNGFKINGGLPAIYSGNAVAAAGDVNGDGYDDLMVGAVGFGNFAGATYIIFGGPSVELPIIQAGTAGNDSYDGGAANDQLSGLDGNDVLNGLAGDDSLDGGDMADILNGGDGADDLIGGNGGDILNGDDGDDDLAGNDGADKLFGGAGADDLLGGLSNDRLFGGDDNDNLNGGDGNDYLDGGAGTDILTGGLGNDIYILGWQDYDTVIEEADGGYDIVRADREVTMADNIEGAELTGSGHYSVYGNDLANNIQGNSGENLLQGRGGVDTINGNDGDDDIAGGVGNDLLRGGLGADTFYLFDESVARAVLETDQIYDFSAAEGDLLNLSFVDANTRMDGDQGFRLVGAFTKYDAAHPELTGQMTLTFAGGITTLRLDVNGDAKVDYQMKINGDVTGESAGWLL